MDPAVAEKSNCFIRIICVISGLPEIIRHFNISWPATEIHLKSSTDRHFLIWDFLRGKESEDSPDDASLSRIKEPKSNRVNTKIISVYLYIPQ